MAILDIPDRLASPKSASLRFQLRLVLACVWIAHQTAPAAEAPPALPKPYLLVEAWHDREYCSDLYAYDFDGKLLRRLTQKPLPSCSLAAVSADGGQVTFVANASTLYNLNMRWESLIALNAGNAEAVAISRDGKGVAYVTRGFQKDSGQFLHLQPLVAGASLKRIEIPLAEPPQEITFAPDGHQLLLTKWIGDRARIESCELETGKIQPWLSDEKVSYDQPTVAPNGMTVTAICENLDLGEWSVVAKPWPDGVLKVVHTGPRGVPLSSPVFTDDGQYLLFFQGGVLTRMGPDGGDAEGVTSELDNQPRPVIHRGLLDRGRPVRPASMPLLVNRWFATIQYEERDGRLVLVDVRTKTKKPVSLPNGKLMRAVVVE